MKKTAVAIYHVAFEDLGIFKHPLEAQGYDIVYLQAGVDDLSPFLDAPLSFVLGGPIGAYEEKTYPFLHVEKELIGKRMQSGRPMMGICLGAQLMAAVLGAKVYSSGKKEIGWLPLHATEAGKKSVLAPFDGERVLQWHGDTFDPPPGTQNLMRSDLIEQQAFIYKNALALQFHIEADHEKLETWLIGHTAELNAAKVDIPALREESTRHGPALARKGQSLLQAWLQSVGAA